MQHIWIAIATVLCLATAPASAGPAKKPRPAAPIANCIGAGPPLALRTTDQRALLEPGDREGVYDAILTRYPILRHHDTVPAHIMLWHKSRDEWLYVHLSPSDDRTPTGLCFTATVTATDFDFTRNLIQKYFFTGASPV